MSSNNLTEETDPLENKQFKPTAQEQKHISDYFHFHRRRQLQNSLTFLVSLFCLNYLLYSLYLWYRGFPSNKRLNPAYLLLIFGIVIIRRIFVAKWSKTAEEEKIFMLETNLRFISPAPYLISVLKIGLGPDLTLLVNVGIYFSLCFQVFYVVAHTLHLSSIRTERRFEGRNIAIFILHSVVLVQIIRWVFWRQSIEAEATFLEFIVGYAVLGLICIWFGRRGISKKERFHTWLEYSESMRFICMPLYGNIPIKFILIVLVQNILLLQLNHRRMNFLIFDSWTGKDLWSKQQIKGIFYAENTMIIFQELEYQSKKNPKIALLQKEQIQIDSGLCYCCIKHCADILLECGHCCFCTQCALKLKKKLRKYYRTYEGPTCPICKQESLFLRQINPFPLLWEENSYDGGVDVRSKVRKISRLYQVKDLKKVE